MRTLSALILALGLAVTAAGCNDFLPVAACGACGNIASKHNATTGCCGRGCVISDPKCPSGFHYVTGNGQSLASCAPMNECFYPDMLPAPQDLSSSD